MRKTVAVALALGMLGLGCGGGGGGSSTSAEGPTASPGTVSPAAAMTGAQQAGAMLDAVNSGNGDTMTGAAFSFGLSGMAAVTPKALTVAPAEGDLKSLEYSGLRPELTVSEVKKIFADGTACTSGTRTCDATGCVWDKCAWAGSGVGNGTYTINGSIKATGDAEKHVVWNIKMDGASSSGGGSATYVFDLTGDLTVSATLVKGKAGGTWSISGTSAATSFSINFGSRYAFNDVVLCKGTPTGGSISIKWWQVVDGSGQGIAEAKKMYDKAYEGTHTFMGTCT